MNVMVVGANGKTGRALVQQACELGYGVTALVHHKTAEPMNGVRVLYGDARNPQFLESAIAGQQAIIDTVGTRRPFIKTTLETDVARLLIDAMRRHGIRRVVAVSSLGVGDSIANVPPLYRALMPIFFRGAIPDKAGMEAELSQSDINWTIVRPAGLTDSPQTGSVQVITPASHRHVRRIARADVASFILNNLENEEFYQKTVGITTE